MTSTPFSTSTLSSYVQEIFKSARYKNHHSKFKKKNKRLHHRKHHQDWDEGVIYTHPIFHHRARQRNHNHLSQHKDSHRPRYRSGHPEYQGHINFFDTSNRLETQVDVDQYIGGHHKDKWPYFAKVKTHLDDESDDLPPYLKKYNRRNKQLIDLLEGTLPPKRNMKKLNKHISNRKNPHWLEDDLFEEQRPNRNSYSNKFVFEPPSTPHPNALPGENVHISSVEHNIKHNFTNNNNSLVTNNHSPPFKISSRAGQFIYHTVTALPQITGSTGNVIKKKRLPFVAITDRKIGPRKGSSINSNSEHNHLPLP